jgi:glutamine amidotransferase
MSKPEVTVIDYGVGNLLSVQRGLEHCGARVILTSDPTDLLMAERVVLPGVGAFASAMHALQVRGLDKAIKKLANNGIPLLGICLGMQLLLDESEEFGLTQGLGLIPGRVVPVPAQNEKGEAQKIPHIGWNGLFLGETSSSWNGSLLKDIQQGEAAYFVHSFMSLAKNPVHRLADCFYGGHRIPAVIVQNSITGCQFHPEKSGNIGLRVLRNFCHG